MVGEHELQTAPEYQRQFRWDLDRESELIESIMLGLPVPPIFVATNSDATWELVDGLQRVSTILHFVEADTLSKTTGRAQTPLQLQGLKRLTEFNGLTYADLPSSISITFMRRPLRATALSDKSQMDVRFDLFDRLNRGGVSLTAQEVRACIFRGPLNELLGRLSTLPKFQELLKLQKGHQRDGTREEQVLKFFAYLEGRSKFDGRVTYFLNSFMEDNKDRSNLNEWEDLFTGVVDRVYSIVGGPAIRKGYPNTPVNQFEALLVAAGELVKEGKRFRRISSETLMNDTDLVSYSTKGTNTPLALRSRIERAKKLLGG